MKFLAPVFLFALHTSLSLAAPAEPIPASMAQAAGGSSTHTVCYDAGGKMDVNDLYQAIDTFCDSLAGRTFSNGQSEQKEYTYGSSKVLLEAKAGSDCSFVADSGCRRLLRSTVDTCNYGSSEKQGGFTFENPCETWRIDPN